MKLYHGTLKKNADEILRRGFEMNPSEDMFLGRGVYLAPTEKKARRYGDVVIEVTLPETRVCEFEPGFAIGVFRDWLEDEIRWREEEHMPIPSEEKLFKSYVDMADDMRDDALKDGCGVRTDGRQYVVYDSELLKKSKLRRLG